MKKTRRRFKKSGQGAPRPAQTPQPAATQQAGVAPLQDNVLRAAEQKIEAQLTPQNRANYIRVVVAGMKAGMAGGADSILASVRHSQDPVSDCAKGAVNLALMLSRESRFTMPPQAMVPAAMTLMLHALDFVDRLGIAKIGATELDRATHVFTNQILAAFHVTPQKLSLLSNHVHGIMQDPAKMEVLARRAGMVKSPMASTPTPLPQGMINQPAGGGNV